jgi:cytochrome c oxidase assembly protein Cox11
MRHISSLVAVVLVMAAMMVAMAMPAVAAQPLYTCTVVRFDGASGDLLDLTPKQVSQLERTYIRGC